MYPKSLYELKNIDCTQKSGKKMLLSFVMQILKLDEVPTKEELEVYCKRFKKKYNVKTKRYDDLSVISERCFVIETNDGYLLTCFYNSTYEGYLKYISLIYFLAKDKRLKKVA
nr:MAG TPA: hypothetical protein [Caudoviricetes sp.]